MRRESLLLLPLLLFALGPTPAQPAAASGEELLVLPARQRVAVSPGSSEFEVVEKELRWAPSRTAIVVCDMWDQHWCRGASQRVAEMAPRMNHVLRAAREKGVLVIHCPSSCMSFYKDTPMRKLAQQAPKVDTQVPLQSWCKLDPQREPALPIDDSDGGCDCWPTCPTGSPWTRQIATIEIKEGDAITDSAEAYYLMKQKGIDNVIVMGVHTNMCVLGRPFSIRQLAYQGQNVVLMRDMTDTMYNSRRSPFVKHTEGTQLVVQHIEKYWCPTITSTVFTGRPPFQFSEQGKPHVVLLVGEREYDTEKTLPVFAREYLEPRGIRYTTLEADAQDGNQFPGLAALKSADALLLSVRRRALPQADLEIVRQFVESGKPVIGIRTANHAFHTRGQRPEGHAEWQSFDADVLGGNYTGHHPAGPRTEIRLAEGAADHPILQGVSVDSLQGNGSLYKVSPLAKEAQPLLIGSIPDQQAEPVAWIHQYREARVFYTSLGHPLDFQNENFNRLLANAITWAIKKPEPR